MLQWPVQAEPLQPLRLELSKSCRSWRRGAGSDRTMRFLKENRAERVAGTIPIGAGRPPLGFGDITLWHNRMSF